MAERTTKVRLSAQVQEYIEGMERAARATRETGSEAEKLSQKREAFEQLGRTALVAGGVVATGLAAATKAAIDWESAWAGVIKTVDGSTEELAAVELGLRGLTAVLPASHTEIAAVAEAAGQLGIETPNVVAFTRTMIDLGETTNLTAQEAATQLARFVNVMGTSQDQVSNLGSALVELGNNYATTEGEILAMAQRLSGAGAQINMSEGQVLGLATALSSVGIEAEAGGSAMSKVMIDIASSVDKGGERLELFASVAGVSADKFAAKWKSDPGAALALFVQGLANAEAQGKSTFAILEELGISEVRMRDALLRSASAADQFSKAMETGNEAFEANNALTDEAAKRYETTAAKLQIMWNQVVDASIGIGQQFLPVIEAAAENVGDLTESFQALGGPGQAVVAWTGAVAAAVLIGGGTFLVAVPKVAAYKAALETLGSTAQRVHGYISAVGKAAGMIGFIYAISEAGSALTDWSATAAGTKKTSDALAASLKETADAGGEISQALAGNSLQRFINVDSAAIDNLRALNTGVGQLQASFEKNSVGKFMTQITSLGTGGNLGRAKENVEALDSALAKMVASGDTDAAADAYRQFAAMAKEAGYGAEEIAEVLPEYTVAAKEAAPATKTSADRAQEAAAEYMEQANAAKAATDELYGLIDALMESNNVAQSAESANARFQQTLASQAENAGSIPVGPSAKHLVRA